MADTRQPNDGKTRSVRAVSVADVDRLLAGATTPRDRMIVTLLTHEGFHIDEVNRLEAVSDATRQVLREYLDEQAPTVLRNLSTINLTFEVVHDDPADHLAEDACVHLGRWLTERGVDVLGSSWSGEGVGAD